MCFSRKDFEKVLLSTWEDLDDSEDEKEVAEK